MKKNSGGLLAFILGAAAGAVLTYFLTSDEGKEVVKKAKEKGKDIKDDLNAEIEKGKSLLTELINSLKNKTPEA